MTTSNENNEVLKFILNERFFTPWKQNYIGPNSNIPTESYDLINNAGLELFITSVCNQHCEYCYLISHPELYPKEFLDKDLIKNNLKKVLTWINDNNFFIPKLLLFTGEIWYSQFGLDILDIILKFCQEHEGHFRTIMIPTNASFILDLEQTQKIQQYINLFAYLDINLQFSLSIDGKIIEAQSRPLNNNQEKLDEFYENCFIFAKRNNFGFHPMVSAQNVKYWKENLDWWESMCNKYNLDLFSTVMMLEVRSTEWEAKNIQNYVEFIQYLFDKDFQRFGNDILTFSQYVISAEEVPFSTGGYLPHLLGKSRNTENCTIPDNLTIRLGDLAIPACHRTAYNKYLYGKFVEEDGKIKDIIAINPYMANRVLMINNISGTMICDTCNYNNCCLKGCYGNQLEENNDPFMPIEKLCLFFKIKYKAILLLYKEYGLIDIYKQMSPDSPYYPTIQEILSLMEKEGLL